MKFTKSICLSIVICACVLAGCGTPTTIAPSVPAMPAMTNAITGAITPAVPALPALVTYAPNQALTQGVAYANQALPYVPDPYKTPIEGGLALLSGIAGLIAAYQTKQSARHRKAAATLASALTGTTAETVAIKTAASNGTAAAVAEHLASAASPT